MVKYADVVQRLSVGPAEAATKLALGERNLERARRASADRDPDGAIISAEAVMVNAVDAILARDGFRVHGKTGSHQARIGYPGLPPEFGEETRTIQAVRRARRAVVLADLIVAVTGLVFSVYSLMAGYGNALIWIWVVAFAVFGAWQAYVLWRPAQS